MSSPVRRPNPRRNPPRLAKAPAPAVIAPKRAAEDHARATKRQLDEDFVRRLEHTNARMKEDPAFQTMWMCDGFCRPPLDEIKKSVPGDYASLNHRAVQQADALMNTLERLLVHPGSMHQFSRLLATAATQMNSDEPSAETYVMLENARVHARETLRRLAALTMAEEAARDNWPVLYALGYPSFTEQ